MTTFKKDKVKLFAGKVKNPGFLKKSVITLDPNVLSYVLRSPTTDYKLFSVEQDPDSKKYGERTWTLPQVIELISL